jgi:hypothetical protein
LASLIDIAEIDQFARIANVPVEHVSPIVVDAIRRLDEKMELEPALRSILNSPDITPHGPTEIADILTPVKVRGRNVLAAFIVKGKATQKVTSKKIGNQILKLREIPSLGLGVLCAVGHIHDDAQTRFIQTVKDAEADFLIIDALTCARLLMAYGKMCPIDGFLFEPTGKCKQGHQQTKVEIAVQVPETPLVQVIGPRDRSNFVAKRYDAILLVDRHYGRDVVRSEIVKATESIRQDTYHRAKQMRELWEGGNAHVVWLYVARSMVDIQNTNWLCRTLWIDPAWPENRHISSIGGSENHHGIEIVWNEHVDLDATFYASITGSKGEVIAQLNHLKEQMLGYFDQSKTRLNQYEAGSLGFAELQDAHERLFPAVRTTYLQASDIPNPPIDCQDFADTCNDFFCLVDNAYDAFANGNANSPQQRVVLAEIYLRDAERSLKRLFYEEEKLHKR